MPAPDMSANDSWRIFRIMSEFVEGYEVMAQVGKAVSIFDSARARPTDPYYKAGVVQYELLVWNVVIGKENLDKISSQ